MASFLRTNHSLRVLNLHMNTVKDEGACALAAALEADNQTLESLNLRMNDVGIAGLGAFAAALENNTAIRLLDLKRQRNKVTSVFIMPILRWFGQQDCGFLS